MPDSKPTICVIDDDAAVRSSLRWLIESVGLAVCTFEDAKEFLASDDADGCACLILDVRLPGMSGLELQDLLNERDRHCMPIIIITGHGDVPMAIRAMKAGAFDFVEKPFQDQTLLDRVHEAVRQHRVRRADDQHIGDLTSRWETLSGREREVMQLVVEGQLNKQIAAALNLSHKTVEVHRSRVMAKMQAPSLAALVRMAISLERAEIAP